MSFKCYASPGVRWAMVFPVVLAWGVGAASAADTIDAVDAGLIARWQFKADKLSGQSFAPLAGKLSASADKTVKFSSDPPHALRLDVVTRNKVKTGQLLTVAGGLPVACLRAKAITVEAWVQVDKPERLGGFACAIQESRTVQRGWWLGNSDDRFAFAVATAESGRLTCVKARDSMQPGYWYHVVGTYDGTSQRLYVDGRQVATSTRQRESIAYPPKASLTLGAYRSAGRCDPLSGQLERVSIWSRALSPTEVRSIFDSRKKSFPYAQPEPPEPVTDWPTYRRDNRRSGTAPEPMRPPLALQWVHKPRQAPDPAWPAPAPADYFHRKPKLEPRVIYDRAFHAVSVGDRVLFGSSSEDKVVCLDARTGETIWQFFTEGPVRVAPAIADGRAVVGCDDGRLYCLSLDEGELLWSHRPAAAHRLIPGNERIISVVPFRTGPIIEDGKVHVLAGIFPLQGVFQEQLDLASGKCVGVGPISISPQGYPSLVLGKLATPTGRARQGAVLTKAHRRGKILDAPRLSPAAPYARIATGSIEFGGGEGTVAAFDANSPDDEPLWSAHVQGRAYGLAAARGRLLVSTDAGYIYCFAETPAGGAAKRHATIEAPKPIAVPCPDAELRKRLAAAAERIARLADGPRGYCLLMGDDSPTLAAELAKRTEWQIVCRIADKARAAEAHRLMDASGLRGVRAAVHRGPLDRMAYTDGLFNVVVDVAGALGETPATDRAEALRVTRPGSLAIFAPDESGVVRTPRPGKVGEWTHTYADVGNTASTSETHVSGKLALQWFGLPGPKEILDRHHRNTPPLAKAGRLFVPGDGVVFGVDAHNGTILWRSEVPGARRLGVFLDCGAMCVDDKCLYVADPGRCVALDVRTGKIAGTLPMPSARTTGTPMNWGYIARTGDLLVGSAALASAAYRTVSREADLELWYDHMKLVTSRGLFALNADSGRPRWTYACDQAVILNTTITIGGGRVYFIESHSPAAVADKLGRMEMETFQPGPNFLVAIDLADGRHAWRLPLDLADCRLIAYLNYADDTLILSGNRYIDKKLWYFIRALDADDGRQKWKASHNSGYGPRGGHGEQNRHPVIVGQTVFSWPVRYELKTGKPVKGWQFSRHGHGCGNVSASADCLFWRGGNPWKHDLGPGGGPSAITAVSRPGCFINILPADGMVLIPEASSGCSCDFPIQASMGFVPAKAER